MDSPLWLVRHASTDWTGVRFCGRSDPPLHADGQAAAEALARRLAVDLPRDRIPRIIASPLQRAATTAAAIADATGSAVETDERWLEIDFGLVEGRTFDEVAVVAPALAARLAAGEDGLDWPDGETAAELDARVRAALTDLATTADGRPTIVVSHGGALRLAIAIVTGRPRADVPWLGPAEVFRGTFAVEGR